MNLEAILVQMEDTDNVGHSIWVGGYISPIMLRAVIGRAGGRPALWFLIGRHWWLPLRSRTGDDRLEDPGHWRGSLMSVSEVCWRSMREVVAEMAAQYYASVAGASNHINNNIINMKVSTENKENQEAHLKAPLIVYCCLTDLNSPMLSVERQTNLVTKSNWEVP